MKREGICKYDYCTIDAKFRLLKMLKTIRMVNDHLLVPFPLTTPGIFLTFCLSVALKLTF